MKKRFYSVCAVAMAVAMTANAQGVIDADYNAEYPFDEGDYAGESAVIVAGATVTFMNEAMNTCAFPFVNGETVTLMEGAKVKFFDSPETAYPDPANFADMGWEGYLCDNDGNTITEIPFNWIIEGTGNEIYLDSYCTMGGTVTGTGDLTIYCTNKSTINFDCFYAKNEATPEFTGTLYLKTLDGYSTDTIRFSNGTFPGHSTDGVSYIKTSGQWLAVPFTMDITGAGNPCLYVASGASAWPTIVGEGSVYTGSSYAFWRNSTTAYYDLEVYGGNGDRDFEIYPGATIAFNKPVYSTSRYAYHRQGQLLLINSKEPSFSNCSNGFSLRSSSGTIGGDGYVDTGIGGKDGSTIIVYPGHDGPNSVGVLTAKSIWLYNNNAIGIDFDGQDADKIVLIDSANFEGANTRFWLNLMDGFLTDPKVGNYKVLDGRCHTAMQPVNDTTGYYVVDSVLTYVNVNTGDTITYYSKIFPNMGNREIDTLAYWGLGEGWAETYVPSPNKISAEDWAAGTYSAEARAAIEAREFMPYTNDTIRYTGHTLTASDLPITEAYDYIYNFNLVVKSNEIGLIQPTGDSLVLARDFFNFTFKSTVTDTITGETSTVMRYTTNKFPRATYAADGVTKDTVYYWFDFTNFFTHGIVALCNDQKPSVDVSEPSINGDVSDIRTINKEQHAVAARTIYTIDGKRVNGYVKGLNIVTTRYTDGTIETRKLFFAE